MVFEGTVSKITYESPANSKWNSTADGKYPLLDNSNPSANRSITKLVGPEIQGTAGQLIQYLASQPQEAKYIVDIMDGGEPEGVDVEISQEWCGVEAAGTVSVIINYLKGQDKNLNCIGSVVIRETR